MQTTTRRTPIRRFAATMLLGLVMAALIAALAEPELAWLGFALAAVYAEAGGRRSCAARLAGAVRR